MAPTVSMGPLADGSISNLACSIPNYRCTNFGAFIKMCTIDQLICSTIRGFVILVILLVTTILLVVLFVTKILLAVLLVVLLGYFVSGFVSDFVSGFVSSFVGGFVSSFVSGFVSSRALLTLPKYCSLPTFLSSMDFMVN